MQRVLFSLAVAVLIGVSALHLLGYFWHRPPNVLYYAILLLNYAPKWVWFVPALIAIPMLPGAGNVTRVIVAVALLNIIWMQDVQWRGLVSSPSDGEKTFTIMSFNTGGVSVDTVARLVGSHTPDIVLLQESANNEVKQLPDSAWYTDCAAHLCIASRYPIQLRQAYDRESFSDWGSFAAVYEASLNGKTLTVINAHLETPRDALGGRPLLDYNARETDDYAYEKNMELLILAQLLNEAAPALVAGDLNTSVFEAAYQHHLGQFTNAVDDAAFGINYTKYTTWHGVRIDHVVTNNSINIEGARVLGDADGDHRAVLATISF